MYEAFGNVLEQTEQVENKFKYTGEQYDSITNQYYLRARYYNSLIGRFIQQDTYHGDGLNLYSYVDNNPMFYVDPSGHAKCDKKIFAIDDIFSEELYEKIKIGENKGKNPAQVVADELRTLSKKECPSTVNVIHITKTDQYIISSNKTKYINEKTNDILDELGNYNEYNRGCAEVSGVSIGFKNNLDMAGAENYCSFVRGLVDENNIHGTYHAPCSVCGPMLKKIGIHENSF